MARIAYVGLPAHGHTNPTLPVVRELVSRGHEVLYYNATSFREKVAPTGVDFRALPEPLPTEQEVSDALEAFIGAPLLISGMSRHLTRFLIDEFARERPDLVIYDSVAMWGYIAARTHGTPNVCFITTFVLDGSQAAIGFGTLARFFWSAVPHLPTLLGWRRSMAQEFGKENSGGITEYAGLNIVFTSEAFHPQNSFVDERFRFVGPSIDPATRVRDFPYEALQPGPKVYVSLGTVVQDNAFFDAVFSAFDGYPAQFIVAAGNEAALTQAGRAPANFLVRSYVPQLDILQQVDAFVTHGGMNSVHEGLYYGVPQIVVPHHFEQLLNGKRVAETGSGILLGEQRPYGRPTQQALRQALDNLLSTPSYRHNARAIGDTLRAAGGYVRAADEIERYQRAQERSAVLSESL